MDGTPELPDEKFQFLSGWIRTYFFVFADTAYIGFNTSPGGLGLLLLRKRRLLH